jgi:hypothetical protein
LQPIHSLAVNIVAMGMRRNIQALARPILPDEFGVWSFLACGLSQITSRPDESESFD